MTDAEKAAAAKAEEEKKAATEKEAADKKAKEAEETDDEGEDEGDSTETVEALKAKLKKVNESDKKRRLELKALKEETEKKDKALAILGLGKGKESDVDPLEQAQKNANAKMSRTLMKAEFMSLARDAHDPAMVFKAHADTLKDVDVDLENETVDTDTLKDRIDDIRKKSPFLFAAKEGEPGFIIKKNPDRSGMPGGGGSEFKEWQKMKQAGDGKGAQAFYQKNREKILLQMGK